MFIKKVSLPRRTFVRGLGVTLAMPLLDAMVPALSALAKTPANPVRRLGFVYVPNGKIMEDWMPTAEGSGFAFPRILKPVEPFRDRLLVVSGLSRFAAGQHAAAAASWLSSDMGWKGPVNGAEITAPLTMDQIAAQHLAQHTQLASLEVALEGADFAGACDGTLSCAYTNTIAWGGSSPPTPLPMEVNPRAVFERLFGDGDTTSAQARLLRLQEDRSILDAVRRDVASLERALGPTDRSKLTQYLDAVRDIERRIQRAEEQNAGNPVPEIGRPIGVPEKYVDHAKLMIDMQVLAFQSDLTRVTSFMLGREISNRSYPEIGVPEPHHSTSHHQGDPEKVGKNIKINTLHVEMFAYYLEKLHAIADGDGTLLDHAMLVYGSGMSDPNSHDPNNLPTLVVGGGAGRLKGGRHVRYPLGTPNRNLFATLLQKLDVPMDQFADRSGKLELLSGL